MIPLLDYIEQLSPAFRKPVHLAKWCGLIEEVAVALRDPKSEPIRAACTEPIRHAKTETTLHGVVWLLEQFPDLAIVVLCYSHERAEWMGKRLRELAGRTSAPGYRGVNVGPSRGWNTIGHWRNDRGGQVTVMSADQSKEGHDCHVLLCDDPIDEHGAELAQKRDEVDRSIEHYTARCLRHSPDGSMRSGHVLLVASRFDLEDPTGRRILRGWRVVHDPAIVNLGGILDGSNPPEPAEERALNESWMSLAELKRWRAEQAQTDPHERQFWSRMQGRPPPRGTSSFKDPALYNWLPDHPGFRDAMGIDMSFSKAKRADWSAIVITRWWGQKCYVRAVIRLRADLGDLVAAVKQAQKDFGKMPIFTYTSGPERAAVIHMQMVGLAVNALHAAAPKFVRAQRTIDAHNAGNILWPAGPMTDAVMGRLKSWRGNEADPDDEADALVSVYDAMAGSGGGTRSLGSWRY